MPTLAEIDKKKGGHQLSLRLDLRSLESYQDGSTEGWISYGFKLMSAGEEVASCGGTIHDSDIRGLVSFFLESGGGAEIYEPLEPDFEIVAARKDEGGITITCFIDDQAAMSAAYGDSGVGVRFNVDDAGMKEFAHELEAERVKITDGKEFGF